MWRTDFDHLLRTSDAVLGPLEHVDLYAAAYIYIPCDTSIEWCSKVYSGGVVKRVRNGWVVWLTCADLILWTQNTAAIYLRIFPYNRRFQSGA